MLNISTITTISLEILKDPKLLTELILALGGGQINNIQQPEIRNAITSNFDYEQQKKNEKKEKYSPIFQDIKEYFETKKVTEAQNKEIEQKIQQIIPTINKEINTFRSNQETSGSNQENPVILKAGFEMPENVRKPVIIALGLIIGRLIGNNFIESFIKDTANRLDKGSKNVQYGGIGLIIIGTAIYILGESSPEVASVLDETKKFGNTILDSPIVGEGIESLQKDTAHVTKNLKESFGETYHLRGLMIVILFLAMQGYIRKKFDKGKGILPQIISIAMAFLIGGLINHNREDLYQRKTGEKKETEEISREDTWAPHKGTHIKEYSTPSKSSKPLDRRGYQQLPDNTKLSQELKIFLQQEEQVQEKEIMIGKKAYKITKKNEKEMGDNLSISGKRINAEARIRVTSQYGTKIATAVIFYKKNKRSEKMEGNNAIIDIKTEEGTPKRQKEELLRKNR